MCKNLDASKTEPGINDDTVLPLLQEKLIVSKQWVETGHITIVKKVDEETVAYEVPVEQETVTVVKIPKNQYVENAPPAMRKEGNITILSVLKEVLIVEKKLLLVEEIHITKTRDTDIVKGSANIRKEIVEITRTDENKFNN